jgi:hypothetical protein
MEERRLVCNILDAIYYKDSASFYTLIDTEDVVSSSNGYLSEIRATNENLHLVIFSIYSPVIYPLEKGEFDNCSMYQIKRLRSPNSQENMFLVKSTWAQLSLTIRTNPSTSDIYISSIAPRFLLDPFLTNSQ